jgi:hypothetical protein
MSRYSCEWSGDNTILKENGSFSCAGSSRHDWQRLQLRQKNDEKDLPPKR